MPDSESAAPTARPTYLGGLWEKTTGHPAGLSTLFFTEMWERASYYGMRALLVLFMTATVVKGGMGLDDKTANAIYGLYTAFVYLVSLPGGWIADRLLGAQKSVLVGGIVITLGHFTLAFPGTSAFFIGLVLVVIGTGFLKPNISALVGELYPEGGARRDAGFTVYYMGINLGAFIGPLLCGYLGEEKNWHWGFGAAGVGMAFGVVQYWITMKDMGEAGRHPVKRRTAEEVARGIDKGWYLVGGGIAAIMIAVGLGLTGMVTYRPISLAENTTFLIVGIAVLFFGYVFIFGGLDATEKKRTIVIVVLFFSAAMFWAGFEQAGSSLNLFADRHTDRLLTPFAAGIMLLASCLVAFVLLFVIALLPGGYIVRKFIKQGSDRSRDRWKSVIAAAIAGIVMWRIGGGIFGFFVDLSQIPASWFQSLNPFFIVILAPVFAAVWVAMARRMMDPSMPVKFAVGLILLGVGFMVMVVAARIAVAGNSALPYWLILTYLLHTMGELCLSPVGLSSVTKLAPKRFVGQMMGTWFLAASLGNLIAGLIAGDFSLDAEDRKPGIATYSAGDIKDSGAMAAKLSEPTGAVSKHIAESLPDSLLRQLSDLNEADSDLDESRDTVADALNRIIEGPSIYDAERFTGVALRAGTKRQLAESLTEQAAAEKRNRQTKTVASVEGVESKPSGEEEEIRPKSVSLLNRMLLEDAFPAELPRGLIFSIGEIKEAGDLVARLNHPTNAVSVFIQGQLSEAARSELAAFDGSASDSDEEAMQAALIKALNGVVQGPSIYEPKRFDGIVLWGETKRLLDEAPEGDNLHRLNRLLIESVYAPEFSVKQEPGRFLGWVIRISGLGVLPSLFLQIVITAFASALLLLIFAKPIRRMMCGVK
jgi:POT family proton-dependent oligopeptide transporter